MFIECILIPICCCVLVVFVLVGSTYTQAEELKLKGNGTVMLEVYSIFMVVLKKKRKHVDDLLEFCNTRAEVFCRL